jgi:hypothetical protein
VEEWAAVGVTFRQTLTYKGSQEKFMELPRTRNIETEDDIIINDYITLTSYGDERKERKNYTLKTLDNSFVVKTPHGYLVRNTANGYKYVYGQYGCKRFSTAQGALKATKNREGFEVIETKERMFVKALNK